jgi:hypothetical protein
MHDISSNISSNMSASSSALQQAMRGAAAPAPRVAVAEGPVALVVGAAGVLGAAVLAELLGRGRHRRVLALTERELASTLPGLVPLPAQELATTAQLQGATVLLVFERQRHSNGRDEAFVRPPPEALLPLAREAAKAGARRLMVVVPHAPALLPGALKAGFASHDEAALATLGFDQVLLLRTAQGAGAPVGSGMERFAHWWLSQMRWMVPEREQAVRSVRLAALVAELATLLPLAGPLHRVLPPEVVAQAAQAADASAFLRAWLLADPPPHLPLDNAGHA